MKKEVFLWQQMRCSFPVEQVMSAELLYVYSPNNLTGAVFSREQLQVWVDFPNENGSLILFDAAYEAFIEDNK